MLICANYVECEGYGRSNAIVDVFAKKIRMARAMAGWNQDELARAAGVGRVDFRSQIFARFHATSA